MQRHLGKRFEDERLRRLINSLQDREQLRQAALSLLDLKIQQEDAFYKVMLGWQGVTAEQLDALLSKPAPPPSDPFDNNG